MIALNEPDHLRRIRPKADREQEAAIADHPTLLPEHAAHAIQQKGSLAKVSLEIVESEVQDFRPLSTSMCLSLALVVALGHRLTPA
jgi:hypothetical protein